MHCTSIITHTRTRVAAFTAACVLHACAAACVRRQRDAACQDIAFCFTRNLLTASPHFHRNYVCVSAQLLTAQPSSPVVSHEEDVDRPSMLHVACCMLHVACCSVQCVGRLGIGQWLDTWSSMRMAAECPVVVSTLQHW